MDAVANPRTREPYLVYGFAGVPLSQRRFEAADRMAVRQVAQETLQGLAHLHSLGLYHSDVKPANVLVEEFGNGGLVARLADLGTCCEVGVLSPVTIDPPRTTMWFRSPEILKGQVRASGEDWLRADVWALGVTLCDVLDLNFHRLKFNVKAPTQKIHGDLLHRLSQFAYGKFPWPSDVLLCRWSLIP